jgi:hypothetical protein
MPGEEGRKGYVQLPATSNQDPCSIDNREPSRLQLIDNRSKGSLLPTLLDPALLGILCFALFSNIPLGYLREGVPRLSVRWFVYIHLSIPFIVGLRIANGVSWRVIPLTLGLAVAGQIIGSRTRRRRRK